MEESRKAEEGVEKDKEKMEEEVGSGKGEKKSGREGKVKSEDRRQQEEEEG